MKTISTAFTRPRKLVGRGERHGRAPDVHAEHVGEAADGERAQRQRERPREPEDDDARAEDADHDEQGASGATADRTTREQDCAC
jgi:hypothetical protein